MDFIPYSCQNISTEDIESVVNVLKSDFITQGPAIETFERSLQQYCQADHAITCSSGTAALHMVMHAIGIGKNDIIWTSPISFVASANCALYLGATIDFIDCDPITANIDIGALQTKLEQAAKSDSLPKALIVVHFSGRVMDMQQVNALCKKYDIAIVEDAAHALGGYYADGSPVGNGQYSDAIIFSFHPVKSIATGEGGAVLTSNNALAEKIQLLRTHGITRDANKMTVASEGPWFYQQIALGYNYRMTDIQAALGTSQMKRLGQFVEKRLAHAETYTTALQHLPLILPPPDKNSAWHLYVIQLDLSKVSISRQEVFNALREKNIGVNVHYIPIHRQPYYSNLGFKEGDFPQSEQYYQRCLSIPLFPHMREDQQEYVIETLTNILL